MPWSFRYGQHTISTPLWCPIGHSLCAQVLSLMWMRTTMNYQVYLLPRVACPYSNTDPPPMTAVPPWHEYKRSVEVAIQRGRDSSVLSRFNTCSNARSVVLIRCKMYAPARYSSVFMVGPLSRFGDTAANVGMLTLLNASPNTKVSAMHTGFHTFLHAKPSFQGVADPRENFCCVLSRLCVSN